MIPKIKISNYLVRRQLQIVRKEKEKVRRLLQKVRKEKEKVRREYLI